MDEKIKGKWGELPCLKAIYPKKGKTQLGTQDIWIYTLHSLPLYYAASQIMYAQTLMAHNLEHTHKVRF